jgi:5,10-methylenetetrahydrofolate reductase
MAARHRDQGGGKGSGERGEIGMRPSQRDENPAGIDLPLDPIPGHSSRGRLERVLKRGEFAVTAELNPPDSANPHDVYERAAIFDGWVDGINAVDASGANCHMSSVGICALLTRMGYAPILQISCRDKNRIAIQGDVLGAAAMGVANILCLTGDGVQAGDQPGAKPVFDLDCMSLLETVRTMRDEKKFLSGRKLTTAPEVFLGAAINPFAPPYDFRPLRLKKKIEAGAQFVQSQYCYDVPMMREYMKRVRDMGLHEKCFIMAGVGPLASARTARWMRTNVPGVHIPDNVIARLEGAQDQKAEGKRLCIDIINEVKEIEGISGIHVMAYRQEEMVAEIVAESGVLKGRRPWKREARIDEQQIVDRLDELLHREALSPQEMAVRASETETAQ